MGVADSQHASVSVQPGYGSQMAMGCLLMKESVCERNSIQKQPSFKKQHAHATTHDWVFLPLQALSACCTACDCTAAAVTVLYTQVGCQYTPVPLKKSLASPEEHVAAQKALADALKAAGRTARDVSFVCQQITTNSSDWVTVNKQTVGMQ